MESLTAPARRLLAATTINAFLSSHKATPPITLCADISIGEALLELSKAGIVSAPCLCRSSDEASSLLGWVHVADVVLSCLKELFPQLLDASLASASSMAAFLSSSRPGVSETREPLDAFFVTLFLSRQIRLLRPGDACGDGAGFFTLEQCDKMTLLDALTVGSLKAHSALSVGSSLRTLPGVAAIVSDVHVTRIIAASEVLGFLAEHSRAGKLGELSKTTVAALAAHSLISLSPPLCLPSTMPTIAALACIHNAHAGFAGIVDEAGRLFACLSISDVRRLHSEAQFAGLTSPVGAFLADVHGGTIPHLVSCTPAANVEQVMQLLLVHDVHQTFVMDEARTGAVGAVSMNDLLQLIARE